MSHAFYDGKVYHKRFTPKVHEFTYPFYLLDIDLSMLSSLKNTLFSQKGFNLFTFKAKDHFGKAEDFLKNVKHLLEDFKVEQSETMHFLTLPRIVNFVFNPISVLIVYEDDKPNIMLAEVHNYNGGRIVYKVNLQEQESGKYFGSVDKDMYVSPFLQRVGIYDFSLKLEDEMLSLSVVLHEAGEQKLIAAFSGSRIPFSKKSIMKLFCKHTFLNFWVVTRTFWQTIKLKFKGMQWNSPTAQDEIRRY